MILMSRLDTIFSSQNSQIDGTTDRFNEQHAPLSFADLWVIMNAIPHRPDVFGCVVPVMLVEHGFSPFIGFEAKQISGMLMPTIVERSQHQLRRDMSVGRVPLVVLVTPNCSTEATPTDRESVRLTPEELSLFSSPDMSSQQLVCNP